MLTACQLSRTRHPHEHYTHRTGVPRTNAGNRDERTNRHAAGKQDKQSQQTNRAAPKLPLPVTWAEVLLNSISLFSPKNLAG